jgi:FdhE protein
MAQWRGSARPTEPEVNWSAHRRRASDLRERYPYAAEPLALYLALLDAWVEAGRLVTVDAPDPDRLAPWAADHVVPAIVKATEAAGPEALTTATRELVDAGPVDILAAWLAGDGLPPVPRYLARASLYPVLVALDDDAVGAACAQARSHDSPPRDGMHCPRCGGPPQLSWRDEPGEALVSARRSLLCARCGHDWTYSASACPSCGETTGSKRTVYAEQRPDAPIIADGPPARSPRGPDPGPRGPDSGPRGPDSGPGGPRRPPAGTLPHLRIEACATCSRYVIDVDRGRDPRAVPEVDELVAIPLDLHAGELGLTKITLNLMGF